MEESNYWKRLRRGRVSRRIFLGAGATAALGTAAAALVGCNAGTTSTGNGGARSAITVGRLLNVLGVDPHIDLTGLDIDTLMYTYLYGWRPSVEEPLLNNFVEEGGMEIVDSTHFIFRLRRGVRSWSIGPAADEELTSEDCRASFIRRGTALTAPDKRYAQRFLPDKGGRLETPDPYTFAITLTDPFAPAIREMANATWAIVPAKVIEAYPNLSQIAFGSGPFILDVLRGAERVVLKKNPNYFLAPRPYLDTITYIIITEGSSLLAAFKSGQHDINGAVLTKADAEDLMSDGRFSVEKFPSLFYPVIHLKMKPPFNNIKVREAMDLALDRDQMISVIMDGEGNYNGPIQWPQTKWALPQEELRAFYRHDLDRAKQLLAEADYPNGFDVKMKIPKVTGATIVGDTAVLIKEQLSRVNINIQIDEVELGAYISSTILPGNFHMTFFPNLPYDEPDRPLSFYDSKGVTGTGNWTGYSNPTLDKLIFAQSVEFEPERRKQIILDAQRMILPEHGPQLTLTGGFGYAARWNHVEWGTCFAQYGPEPCADAGPAGVDWRIVDSEEGDGQS